VSKVLFVCKKRMGYGYGLGASGLLNSAQFMVDMLNDAGVPAKLVQVVDNNDIDREVFSYRPTHVMIEAVWVVPEKFDVLARIHPGVKWIVRVHSDVPFLAEEGVAVEWFRGYLKNPAVSVAFNSERAWEDFSAIADDPSGVLFLPNYYPVTHGSVKPAGKGVLRVGCFGAIRPMKNQLLQAIASIRYADKVGRVLEFHVNGTRCEGGRGMSVLRNLRSLFAGRVHRLVEWPWMTHEKFLDVMSRMDIALAVSMTETFCIVAADAISCGVPLICSDQIPWASSWSIVDTTDADAIIDRMGALNGWFRRLLYRADKQSLKNYVSDSRRAWLNYLR
jgi:glycosyltransferase involved in cell wall biosynthesis